jgi:hypothetical protein
VGATGIDRLKVSRLMREEQSGIENDNFFARANEL